MSEEIEVEPIPGLPHHLPAGERLLWQGRPRWQGLARHCFEMRWLVLYFGFFVVARGTVTAREGQGLGEALAASAMVVPLALACLGVLSLLAWLNARATVYTITSRRVVMRFGIALPMTFNFPFKRIASADLKVQEHGDGDIALELSGPDRIAWLNLWPHARPWHFTKAQPMLRAIPEAARVATLLGDAVKAWSVEQAAPVPSVIMGAANDSTAPSEGSAQVALELATPSAG